MIPLVTFCRKPATPTPATSPSIFAQQSFPLQNNPFGTRNVHSSALSDMFLQPSCLTLPAICRSELQSPQATFPPSSPMSSPQLTSDRIFECAVEREPCLLFWHSLSLRFLLHTANSIIHVSAGPESLNVDLTCSMVTLDSAADSVKLMSFCDGNEIEIWRFW